MFLETGTLKYVKRKLQREEKSHTFHIPHTHLTMLALSTNM